MAAAEKNQEKIFIFCDVKTNLKQSFCLTNVHLKLTGTLLTLSSMHSSSTLPVHGPVKIIYIPQLYVPSLLHHGRDTFYVKPGLIEQTVLQKKGVLYSQK